MVKRLITASILPSGDNTDVALRSWPDDKMVHLGSFDTEYGTKLADVINKLYVEMLSHADDQAKG